MICTDLKDSAYVALYMAVIYLEDSAYVALYMAVIYLEDSAYVALYMAVIYLEDSAYVALYMAVIYLEDSAYVALYMAVMYLEDSAYVALYIAVIYLEDSAYLHYIITYLVSYRRSIEIWQVCKIYGRRGGAEPFIYFTNPPYFYRPSGTDQISGLFCRGPWTVYAVTKIWKNSTQASYIYGRVLRAKIWRSDLHGRRHRLRCEYQGRHEVVPLLKSLKK